jgi:cyclophilin family peptidyl-prolyl cis-trans isomerase
VPKAAKRERQRLNRMARREALLAQEKRRKRNRTVRTFSLILLPFVALFIVLQVTNGGGSSSSDVACGASAPPKPKSLTYSSPPAMSIDVNKTYTAAMKTSCGTVTITLDAKDAPQTVNSFVFLARKGFYNGTTFHRIVKDFVNQGGDPTGTGSGGPGYKLPDEPPAAGYAAGSVAMANSGSGTTGSQFFLVVSDNGAKQLGGPPYLYSALGTMDVKSLAVAKKINTFGDANEKPTKPVYVDSVTITEK